MPVSGNHTFQIARAHAVHHEGGTKFYVFMSIEIDNVWYLATHWGSISKSGGPDHNWLRGQCQIEAVPTKVAASLAYDAKWHSKLARGYTNMVQNGPEPMGPYFDSQTLPAALLVKLGALPAFPDAKPKPVHKPRKKAQKVSIKTSAGVLKPALANRLRRG